jgi:hypothetical protein
MWRPETNKNMYPPFFHIIAFVTETFVPAVSQVVKCRGKESGARGLHAPPPSSTLIASLRYKEVEVACTCNVGVVWWTITFLAELLLGLCYDTNTLRA